MKTLQQLRQDIEVIDEQIIKKLALREKKVTQIGALKKASGTQVTDLKREEKLFALYEKLSDTYGLPFPWVKEIFKRIIKHSRDVQSQ